MAQGDSGSSGHRFVVDGVVKAETISHEVDAVDAVAACLLKAA